nr:head maturation protease, ClpP-related [uncultured Treponema sp.]
MKEILIDKEIGGWFGITANDVRKQFDEVEEGEEIKLVVDCPGGDCFEGISIYNFIRDYARNHTNKITTYIQGMAASAASWIVCAANSVNSDNKIIVEDNSIFMIHNCWGVAIGDHREMQKSADFSKRIDNLIIKMLSNRSKKDEKKIEKLMADETWYFGNEILDNGFCDEVIASGRDAETDPLAEMEDKMNEAKVAFNSCQKKLKDEVEKNPKAYKDCFEKSYKAFNLVVSTGSTTADGSTTTTENCEKSDFSDSNKTSEKSESKEMFAMNKQELLAQNKALYDEVYNEGSAAAVTKERQRVSDLLAKFDKAGNANAALDFIKSGASVTDNEVIDALVETAVKSKAVEDRKNDEPPAFTPKPESKNDKADENTAVVAAFNKAMGV